MMVRQQVVHDNQPEQTQLAGLVKPKSTYELKYSGAMLNVSDLGRTDHPSMVIEHPAERPLTTQRDVRHSDTRVKIRQYLPATRRKVFARSRHDTQVPDDSN